MSQAISRAAFLERFSCLGAECEDTCCRRWNMQLDDETYKKYQSDAPELIAATDGDEVAGRIMRRDPATDVCVKFEGGLCGIHKKFGTAFLGDACHFYPRVTRRLGETVLMTAALSCPEVTRLMLQDNAFAVTHAQEERLPHSLKDYLPGVLDANSALAIHTMFLNAASDESAMPERVMTRIVSVSNSLRMIDSATWHQAAPFYLKSADARLSAVEENPGDPFSVLQALLALQAASGKLPSERLTQTLDDMVSGLNVTIDDKTLLVVPNKESVAAVAAMQQRWRNEWSTAYAMPLKRWIQGQLSLMLFPFSGFGETLDERAILFSFRFAATRLALMCALSASENNAVSEKDIVRVMQSLSRLLDHLANPALSLAICRNFEWLREGRVRSLVGDVL